jgi:hypothetical protein
MQREEELQKFMAVSLIIWSLKMVRSFPSRQGEGEVCWTEV